MSNRHNIGRVAVLLDRREGTIRKWERENRLPQGLRSKRDERGWRYWSEDQISRIKEWMIIEDMRPGKGLPHASKPTPEKVAEHLRNLRRPRKRT